MNAITTSHWPYPRWIAHRGAGKALPACLARALAPMAPPQSVIHQIIQEDDLLAADRARNVNKAERAIEREAEYALDLQIKHQNLPGELA